MTCNVASIVGNAGDCGAGSKGGKGFSEGNTCAVGKGKKQSSVRSKTKKTESPAAKGGKVVSAKLSPAQSKAFQSLSKDWKEDDNSMSAATWLALKSKGALDNKMVGMKRLIRRHPDFQEKVSTKKPDLFPKIKTGGYTARFGFSDEGRGERHFDSNFGIRHSGPGIGKNQFQITHTVKYDGGYGGPAGQIGKDLKPGTQVSVAVSKWNRKGKAYVSGRTVTIKDVQTLKRSGDYDTYLVTYE